MKISLKDKVIWIIGASLGIGKDLSLLISQESPRALILSGRTEESLAEICSEIKSDRVSYKILDIGDSAQVLEVGSEIKSEIGEVDILIVASGIYEITYVDNFSPKEYEKIMRVNYLGALYATEAVLQPMIKKQAGVLVILSSIAGVKPIPGGGAYGASKAALTYFFEALRMQVQGLGIKIILVHPGFVSTRLTSKNKFKMLGLMQSQDVALKILNGIKSGRDEISFPLWFVSLIRILRFFPEPIYRKIVMSLNKEGAN